MSLFSSFCLLFLSTISTSTIFAFFLPGPAINEVVRFGDSQRSIQEQLRTLSKRRRHCAISSSRSSNDNISSSRRKKNQRRRSPFTDDFAEGLISNIFFGSSSKGTVVPLFLSGRSSALLSSQTVANNTKIETIWLSAQEDCQKIADAFDQYRLRKDDTFEVPTTVISGLPIPLSPASSQSAITLLTQTYSSKPVSKSSLLISNSLFVNRDGGLFDNIPWSTWTIDPNRYEKDAADNVVEEKYTMGKRVAYQRFMGKDWKGRSLSSQNLLNRLRFYLDRGNEDKITGGEYAQASPEIMGDMGKFRESKVLITEYYNDGVQEFQSTVGENDSGSEFEDDSTSMMLSLSKRLLELEIKEATMEIAECEQWLAITSTAISRDKADNDIYFTNIGNTSGDEAKKIASQRLQDARERLRVAESSFRKVMDVSLSGNVHEKSDNRASLVPIDKSANKESEVKTSTNVESVLLSIFGNFTAQDNPSPYRGAIGYPPTLDSREEILEFSIFQYSSPYELLLEIIDEQLNSFVIGCVMEQASLLEGNLVLGGALLLQRKGVQKSSTVLGEIVSYVDEDDDLGNDGVLPRSMYIVECFVDEALGVALAAELPLFIDAALYERVGGRAASLASNGYTAKDGRSIPHVRPVDRLFFPPQIEGERVSSEEESNSIRIPLTSNPSRFDGFPSMSSSNTTRSVFSSFSPVSSLDEYDTLSDDAKARLLLKLESFTGALPRPRTVRTSVSTSSRSKYDDGIEPPSVLDELLLPLIDESIRRQYRIRDAERRKDYAEADALRATISLRQAALEKAQSAREEGLEDIAKQFDNEAEFYKSLRADVTQDENSYDRYLDRDEWYERETQARLKRMNKSK